MIKMKTGQANPAENREASPDLMGSPASLVARLRIFMVLGRVSNLATVWSNCLAAWLIAGGGSLPRFFALCGGATLLYTGGMFLNDAFDVEFDRQFRAERPIPSGQISLGAVWMIAIGLLLSGWLLTLTLGVMTAVYGALLLAAIVFYDALHKHTSFSPLLMSSCRFLLYLLAAVAAGGNVRLEILWPALALAAYVAGLSFFARNENQARRISAWPAALLCAPIAAVFASRGLGRIQTWAVAGCFAVWVVWCLWGSISKRVGAETEPRGSSAKIPPNGLRKAPRAHENRRIAVTAVSVQRGVAGLLAGIVLVDWLAAFSRGCDHGPIFTGFFVAALALRRLAPAT